VLLLLVEGLLGGVDEVVAASGVDVLTLPFVLELLLDGQPTVADYAL